MQSKKGASCLKASQRGVVSDLVWCGNGLVWGWERVWFGGKQVLAAGVTWVEHPWRDRCHASTAATGVWFGGAS